MPPRYRTHLRGRLWFGEADDGVGFELRVIEEVTRGTFHVTQGSAKLESAYGSLDEARRGAEGLGEGGDAMVEWAGSLEPRSDEGVCFSCGLGVGRRLEARSRYPEELCTPCVWEVVDEDGGVAMQRWFAASTRDDAGRRARSGLVRGRRCWLEESYFGGIVVVPYERRPGA